MKTFFTKSVLAGLLLVPAAAFAQYPSQWTGPYIGIKAGLNQSSLDNFSSENAFMAGLYGGYDWQLSEHLVLGGDIFYEWNQDTDHTLCIGGSCGKVNFGSNVYGLEGRVGFPLGNMNNFMPYIKVGYSHLDVTGDASGDDNGWRFGGGLEWRLSPSMSLTFEYVHAKYGDEIGNWENNNFTAGVSFRF